MATAAFFSAREPTIPSLPDGRLRSEAAWFRSTVGRPIRRALKREFSVYFAQVEFGTMHGVIDRDVIQRYRRWFRRHASRLYGHGRVVSVASIGIDYANQYALNEAGYAYKIVIYALIAIKAPDGYRVERLLKNVLEPHMVQGRRRVTGEIKLRRVRIADEVEDLIERMSLVQTHRFRPLFDDPEQTGVEPLSRAEQRSLITADQKMLWAFVGLQRYGHLLKRAKSQVRPEPDPQYLSTNSRRL